MPFVTLYLKKGCGDAAIETSMREISAAGAEILENTLLRMIRVTVLEAAGDRVYVGGEQRDEILPTVIFNVGPGRSAEAKLKFMDATAEILHKNLGCSKQDVRAFILDSANPNNFAIGGQLKDFSKKVN